MKKTDSYAFRGLLVGILFVLLVLISILVLLLFPSMKQSGHLIATITQHGKVIEKIDLSEVTNSYEIQLSDEAGCENTILVSPGAICMQQASCPDKLCVKTGISGASLLPIICLPNEVSISLQLSSKSGDMDAITY